MGRRTRKAKQKRKTTSDFNRGRTSVIDTFIDQWTASFKDIAISVIGSAILIIAYFYFAMSPKTLAEFGKLMLGVTIVEACLLGLAFGLRYRRNVKIRNFDERNGNGVRTSKD